MKFGTKANAAVKDTVTTKKAGTFDMNLRYSATSDIKNIDLYVNGSKVKTLSLQKGSSLSDWKMITEKIALKEGDNKIELKANASLPSTIYLDCFTVNGDFGDASGPKTLNGTLIKNLAVNDTKNASNWSIDDSGSFGTGSSLFGDRNITATFVPKNLTGAEIINTACDSKMYTNDLGTFTAGADITVYIAMDTRVVSLLPEWLGNWNKTDIIMTSNNNLTFEFYKKDFKSGETVTLGMNGGNGNCVNYTVYVTEQVSVTKGDVNLDGRINIFDLGLAKQGFKYGFDNDSSKYAADIDNNGKVEISDITQLQKYILGIIKNFNV